MVVKWFVREPDSDKAAELLRHDDLTAPDLILAETGNALWKKVLKREIGADQAQRSLRRLQRSVDMTGSEPFAHAALAIALELSHPIYDCFYLALAEAADVPLITADIRLVRSCRGGRFERLLRPL